LKALCFRTEKSGLRNATVLRISNNHILSVFSGEKQPPPQNDAAAAAAATLRTRHKRGRRGGRNCFESIALQNGEKWVKKRNCALNIQITNILSVFSGKKPPPPQNDAAAAAVLTRGQTQHRKSKCGNAELTNCKNSGSPEEKKKSVDMYTIVCASIDKFKLSALDRIAQAAVFLQIKSNDDDKYTFVCASKIINEILRSLLPVRRTELLMRANNVLDRTAKVAVYYRVNRARGISQL
jgi:hypothetical protein